jgi:F420-0:gamma-glutamyl ligase
MLIKAIRTKLFHPNDDLVEFVVSHIKRPPEKSVIVVTTKIVALAEGRIMAVKNESEKEHLIRSESEEILRTPWCWLTKRRGEWCANASVDESNANGRIILFPSDPEQTANILHHELKRRFRLKHLGILLTDSRIYPLRVGTMGAVAGYAGFAPLKSYIGTTDLFGRVLKHTIANVVNSMAVSAVLVMGEGKERTPLAIIQNPPIKFTSRTTPLHRLFVDPCNDLYRAAYECKSIRRRGCDCR